MAPDCPLCRASNAAPSFRRAGIPYFSCATCRFRFSLPERNANLENGLADFEDAYLQYLRPDPSDVANFEALRDWMERFRPLAGTRLLDVGCGGGKLVRFLRERNVEAYGLEPSRALYDHFLAREPGFFAGFAGDFAPGWSRPFDVVTAFDVVEHVADPIRFLRDLARLVEVGGHVFVSAPDVGSVLARITRSRWHYYDRYHLSYFSRRTLERAAAATGFEVLGFDHLGRRKPVGYLVRYLCDFVLGRRPPRWVSALDRVSLRVNLFDTIYAAFRRR